MKVAFAMPVYGQMESQTQHCCQQVSAEFGQPSWAFVRGISDIAAARSEAAHAALQSDPDVVIWVDGDMVFSADDVRMLLSTLEQDHTIGIAGALYISRNRKQFCAKVSREQATKLGEVPLGERAQWVFDVLGVGFGLTAVRSEVFERIECPNSRPDIPGGKKHFFHHCLDEHDQPLTEDLSFCFRARQAGFRVVINPAVTPGHIGQKVLYWNDLGSKDTRPPHGLLTFPAHAFGAEAAA